MIKIQRPDGMPPEGKGGTKEWTSEEFNWDQHFVVGLDLSYTGLGLVALGLDGSWKAKVHAGHYAGPRRLLAIDRWVTDVLSQTKLQSKGIEHLCMENYAFQARFGREAAGELGGVIKTALVRKFGWTSKIGYPTLVSSSQLKKYATGDGSSGVKKEQVMLGVYKRWGVDIPNNNAVDAYVLARIAHQHLWGGEIIQAQQDVLKKLKWNTEFPEKD